MFRAYGLQFGRPRGDPEMLFGSLIDCALPDDIIIFKSHEGLGEFGLKVPQINQLLNNENSEYQKNYEKIIFDTTMFHYKKIR